MSSYAIEVLELSHQYNAHLAVDHISLNVLKKTIIGLLGPNGAGKSTTLKMLTTLLPPTTGTAKIMGYDISCQAALVRKCIGYVPQLLSADGDLSGYENLLITAKLYGLPKDKRKKRIDYLLDFMGLKDFSHQLVKQYSGGMIRRLEIAQALVQEPHVLFLDEPTVGLDPAVKRLLWQKIKDLRTEFGTTIFLSTHDMDEADFLCDTIAFMHSGRLLLVDSPKNLKKALGPTATLDDVFIHSTGTSIREEHD